MSTRLNAWTSALCVVAAIGVSLAAEPTSPAQAGGDARSAHREKTRTAIGMP